MIRHEEYFVQTQLHATSARLGKLSLAFLVSTGLPGFSRPATLAIASEVLLPIKSKKTY